MILKTANGDLVKVVTESQAERDRRRGRERYAKKVGLRLELAAFERKRAQNRIMEARVLSWESSRAHYALLGKERARAAERAQVCRKLPVRRS